MVPGLCAGRRFNVGVTATDSWKAFPKGKYFRFPAISGCYAGLESVDGFEEVGELGDVADDEVRGIDLRSRIDGGIRRVNSRSNAEKEWTE